MQLVDYVEIMVRIEHVQHLLLKINVSLSHFSDYACVCTQPLAQALSDDSEGSAATTRTS